MIEGLLVTSADTAVAGVGLHVYSTACVTSYKYIRHPERVLVQERKCASHMTNIITFLTN